MQFFFFLLLNTDNWRNIRQVLVKHTKWLQKATESLSQRTPRNWRSTFRALLPVTCRFDGKPINIEYFFHDVTFCSKDPIQPVLKQKLYFRRADLLAIQSPCCDKWQRLYSWPQINLHFEFSSVFVLSPRLGNQFSFYSKNRSLGFSAFEGAGVNFFPFADPFSAGRHSEREKVRSRFFSGEKLWKRAYQRIPYITGSPYLKIMLKYC